MNNKDELYHYYSGANYIYSNMYSDELYHYGVPGMKWGQRKARPVGGVRLNRKISRLQNKQNTLRTAKGVESRKYRKVSRKLFKANAKQELIKAKSTGDKATIKKAKAKYKVAKLIKRHGTAGVGKNNLSTIKKIYGKNLTDEQAKRLKKKDARGKALGDVATFFLAQPVFLDRKLHQVHGRIRVNRSTKKMNKINKKYS